MEGSSKTGERAPHDQSQQPLEMGPAANELTEKVKNRLFHCAMKREWDKVVSIYNEYPAVHSAKLIRSGDTALHIAVSFREESIVEQLVKLISSQGGEPKKSLEIKNKRGNTALHIAAERGSVTMCRCIAQIYSEGLGVQNNDQETPFFVAALNGKKAAFLCLHSLCPSGKVFPRIRGKEGKTVLHCAIHGDYLDLAFEIIKLYPELADRKTENGLSPLHVLASKPNAFRSGNHFGWFSFREIIYSCIHVDELKDEESKGGKEGKASTDGGVSEKLVQNVIRKFSTHKDNKTEEQSAKPNEQTDVENQDEQRHETLPANRRTCFETIKLVLKAIMVVIIFGLDLCGFSQIRKVRQEKQKHTRSVQVMNQLLHRSTLYQYEDDGGERQLGASPGFSDFSPEEMEPELEDDETEKQTSTPPASKDDSVNEVMQKMVQLLPAQLRCTISDGKINIALKAASDSGKETPTTETPILIAAKNGITEMVEHILHHFPVAIHDTNSGGKNIVLLAVENRKPRVYQLLMKEETMKEVILHKVDIDGNSALHLAAKLGDNRPWHIPGEALQMLWELNWFESVKQSVPMHFFPLHNKAGQTPEEIFTETHKELVKSGSEWLTNTSQSCSVVAALIATVAFATSSTMPGGVRDDSGTPILENKPAFDIFAISSLVALSFSVTSLVMFLIILTSRRQEKDFGRDLPRRLLFGLTSLFISIGSMLISFCAGHFFVLKAKLKYAALPVYAATCLPATFFAVAQFPLLSDLYMGYL